ncbi:acyl-CoA dehydrogenase family protein [Camelimonas abortus]|uniref:acyl-CoA dehydrogenase family protein n=1 Tax=Camelimonas abortus TaxID=1017184 RepID=UPI0035EF7461
MAYRSPWMTDDIAAFCEQLRRYLQTELAPHAMRWREQKMVDRSAWRGLGEMGALLCSIPEEYGGMGLTFAWDAAVMQELETWLPEMATGVSVHSIITAHYINAYGTHEQKLKWLPKMAKGEWVGAIAMTEPGAGSDLQGVRTTARREGDHYVINGAKTFITNGQLADIIVCVTKTDPTKGAKGISLIVIETEGAQGFRRGRNLDKIGLQASDTSELFFDDLRVPAENLLGPEEGQGFVQLMQQLPQERLGLSIQAIAAIERAIAITTDYVKERKAFGKSLIEFQNTAFRLAERKTEAMIGRVFIDYCIERLIAGDLDTVTASMAKQWLTDRQGQTVDECLQLHGGYGYMQEYEISRRYIDARIQRIYGGTNEIMKLLVSRSL